MKKLLLLHLLLAMFFGAQTVKADVVLNFTNFPDPNFFAYISNRFSVSVGKTISDAKLAEVKKIDVNNMDISSLQGIEYFTELTQLDCKHNLLTSLDVSYNTKLTWLYCDNNQLTSLDLKWNPQLIMLTCDNNKLTSLDISRNTNLAILECANNQLTSLDISKNTNLANLDCYTNKLTSLDVSNNSKLIQLICSNNQLLGLDISGNTELTNLECSDTRLRSLDISSNSKLMQLICRSSGLSSLDVSNSTELTYLNCSNNHLTSLDVSKNTKLTELYCIYNQLTSLDVSKNTKLTKLDCYSNQLTSLDVSKNTELTDLDCSRNQLSRLDVSNNTKLKNLFCPNNNIGYLNLSKNTELEILVCASNKIDQLNLSNNTKLTQPYCQNNRLTNLKLDNNTSLISANVSSQSSTRRFQIMSNGSNVNDCWSLYVGTTDASRIRNLKIDGVSKTPSFVPRNSDGWMIVSDDLKKIPLKVEYEFYTGNAVAGWMPVVVNYDVKKYGVYIDDIELTSLNFYDIPGLKEGIAYFYDGSEGSGLGWSGIVPTLVLYDAKIETKEGIHNIEGYSLNIIVRGDNEVIATDFNAFESYAGVSTTFRGGGTLHLTATSDRWHGIYPCDSRITIKEATKIIAQGDGYGYFDDNSILYIQDNSILACYGNKYPSVELPVVSQRKFDSNIDVRYPVGAYMDSGHHVYYAGTTTDVQKDWVVIGPDNQATQDFIIATGISLTEEGRSQTEDGAIYNLAGQRLSKTQRGINIVGGKKIIRE